MLYSIHKGNLISTIKSTKNQLFVTALENSGPLSKLRLWYNIHLLERNSIRWRNAEDSPPSLKPKLFFVMPIEFGQKDSS